MPLKENLMQRLESGREEPEHIDTYIGEVCDRFYIDVPQEENMFMREIRDAAKMRHKPAQDIVTFVQERVADDANHAALKDFQKSLDQMEWLSVLMQLANKIGDVYLEEDIAQYRTAARNNLEAAAQTCGADEVQAKTLGRAALECAKDLTIIQPERGR